ncbi:MAG TPA: DUF2780 domain-containing protein [Thermoanaerobaculia bacterium]|nr:DUF2780 domain-containing protein [Thermoanaerobaculia bacterium]HUM30424.1 DUF2780 domain-containing protein [Thermoanaerobaculia bacterium]HXK68565.1 DUF2780 domain-containing protein [Thermoanaerobaculia bacterium]
MELLQLLSQNLGVSESQAKGGAGLIFELVKDKLSDHEFSQVASAVPGVDQLIKAAPKSSGLGGMLGGLAGKMRGDLGSLGQLASLAGGFKSLHLDADMIGKFVPVILSFVQSKGGNTVKSMLEGVLK